MTVRAKFFLLFTHCFQVRGKFSEKTSLSVSRITALNPSDAVDANVRISSSNSDAFSDADVNYFNINLIQILRCTSTINSFPSKLSHLSFRISGKQSKYI